MTTAAPHKAAQLKRRIAARFVTVVKTLQLGPLTLPFTCIADPDSVLDQVAAAADLRERLSGHRESDPQHLPYWAELWDSAVGMATYLATNASESGKPTALPSDSSDPLVEPRALPIALSPATTVLDLGCGMGLTGTVAATLGASVTFADMEQDALLFALLNTAGLNTRARRLNWQRDTLAEKFDLILGADILYERKQWEHLEPFWRAHLAENGQILLGEPGRPTGDSFIGWIAERGWQITVVEHPVNTRPKPIRLFFVKR